MGATSLTHGPIANGYFDDLDTVLVEHCCVLADDPERLRAETLFHWWPACA